ncbi:MAG: hypothetical protein JW893_02635 [Candidatus Omnitrophica bacterium]|nr:hypothetical protein [Candidatus Omnitrophota bacterium]
MKNKIGLLILLAGVVGIAGMAWFVTRPGEKSSGQDIRKETLDKATQFETNLTAKGTEEIPESVRKVLDLPNLRLPQKTVPQMPKVPKTKMAGDLANIQKVTQVNKAVEAGKMTQTVPPEMQVARIQSRINQIIDLNQLVKSQTQEQAREMQAIRERAEIHQQILSDLQVVNDMAKLPEGDIAREKLIQAEKMRIINEETEKDYQVLEDAAGLSSHR